MRLNMLLFRLIPAKFANNCQSMNFFCNWKFSNPRLLCINALLIRRKPAKYVIFCDYVPKFWIEVHSTAFFDKVWKQSHPIASNKLLRALRNSPALHENQWLFWKLRGLFHKNKCFRKTENFPGLESPALVDVFDGISKFGAQIPPWNSSSE